MSKRIYLSDNIHNNIQITSFEKSVISTSIFNRLHNIYQNSTVFLTFPTCRHKRFEHSIGVMKLAGDSYANSISNSDRHTLKYYSDTLKRMLQSIFKTKIINNDIEFLRFLTKIKENCLKENLFKEIQSNDNEDIYIIHCITYQALRFAALLHDLGHPPYSHIVENSLVKLYKQVEMLEKNDRVRIFKETFDQIIGVDSGKQLHEEVGFILIDEIKKEIEDKSEDKEFISFCLEVAKKIIAKDDIFNINFEDLPNALHSLIDGEIDADRFDYVCRDARNSGFKIDNLNYARFYSNFSLQYKKISDEPNSSFMFCPNEKTIDIIDDFFLRKDQLYSKVIYHHRSNKMGILMENVVYKISLLFLENKIDLESSDASPNRDSIADNISGLWIPLNKEYNQKNNIMLIQWDDSWLNNILKKYLSDEVIRNDITLLDGLIELVSNQKKYNSYIKRIDDFIILNYGFLQYNQANIDFIRSKILEMEDMIALYESLDDKTYLDVFQKCKTIKNSLIHIISQFHKKRSSDTNNHEMLIQWLKVKSGQATNIMIDTSIRKLLNEDINIDGKVINLNNSFIGNINHKEVIKEFFVYLSKDDQIVSYKYMSALPEFLKHQSCYSVGFHVYTTVSLDYNQRREFLSKLGVRLAELFFNELQIFLKNTNELLSKNSNVTIKTEA